MAESAFRRAKVANRESWSAAGNRRQWEGKALWRMPLSVSGVAGYGMGNQNREHNSVHGRREHQTIPGRPHASAFNAGGKIPRGARDGFWGNEGLCASRPDLLSARSDTPSTGRFAHSSGFWTSFRSCIGQEHHAAAGGASQARSRQTSDAGDFGSGDSVNFPKPWRSSTFI